MAVTEKDQRELVEAAAGGDIESFGELARRYYASMVAIAYSVLADHQLAEDTAQESFAKALVGIMALKDKGKFGPWMASICRNTAKDILTKNRTDISRDDFVKVAGNDKSEDKIHAVRRAIKQLPGSARELIVLRYYDGLSYEEISSVLGISKASINGRLTRAKRNLAKYLRYHGIMGDEL